MLVIAAICSGDPPCGGRGSCVSPDVCTCDIGWDPPSCTECANGYQPPTCSQCTGGLLWPECTQCTNSHRLPPDCVSCIDGKSF